MKKQKYKSTYEELISDPEQKALFEKEYADLCLSEFLLEKMEEEKISVRALAKKADVSPTIIQKIRTGKAENINFKTFTSVLYSLGYKVSVEKFGNA